MPRAAGTKNYFQFTQGKITEANLLNFPENAMSDELNIDINRDGSVQRRLGLDYETGYDLTAGATGISPVASSLLESDTYLWKNVSVNAGTKLDILVVRYSTTLYFYDAAQDSVTDGYLGSLNIFGVGNDVAYFFTFYYPIEFSSGKNRLYLTSKLFSPIFISYDGTTFTSTKIDVEIRDFTGVDDGFATDYQPTNDMSDDHRYNLLNQGWYPQLQYEKGDDKVDIIDGFYNEMLRYPSNANISHLSKREGFFEPRSSESTNFGNTPAPKGHFILNVFNADRSAASGLSNMDSSDGLSVGFSTIAFFAGRAWYAGNNDKIYYSQIIKEDADVGKCYQEQDPTCEDLNELLATDGGVISLPGAGDIVKLIAVGRSLLVIADNGLWQVTGSDGLGFTATSFSVLKVSEIGSFYPRSVVEVNGTIIFWSDTGIYVVQSDQTTGHLTVTSISENTIQSDYTVIPYLAKKQARGYYDRVASKVYWLYAANPDDAKHTTLVSYDSMLILNTSTGSFHDYTIGFLDSNTPIPIGIFKKTDTGTGSTSVTLVDSAGDTVVDSGGNTVIVNISGTSTVQANNISIVTLAPYSSTYSITFSEFSNRNFVDWESADTVGKDYSSYIETGYENLGQPHLDKQATYVFCYFNRTEDGYESNGSGGIQLANQSSCKMRAKWEWTNYDVGRWSDSVEVYRLRRPYMPTGISDPFNYGFQVVETKNKVRGKGKAMTLRFESSAGKDFQLLGWAVPYTVAGAA